MVGAIIAGLHLGYSIKGWMAQTGARDAMRQAAEARPPESGSAESAPPRRGDEWSPGTSSARVDQSPRTPHRAPAPKGSPPAPVEAPDARPWVRLTALMGEGIRLHRDGWYGPAMARFREAVAIMPDYLRAYLWLGRSGLKAGRYEEARRALERVIALGPHSAAAQEARALLSQLEKDN
jgi:TolA-binding protein